TGMTFGYGARFPAKYQNALFLCDWSYGKLHAVHLQPDGSTYRGDVEEFLSGTPLPLTDIVISSQDGAMYFIIGGRKTMSGLYRVTYIGADATVPFKAETRGAEARDERKKLESNYLKNDPGAIDAAWPYLAHGDRFLRYAGRTVLEHQDPERWQERALKEKSPRPLLASLLALVRSGDRKLQPRVLEALAKIDWEMLAEPLKQELIRVYELAFIRMGNPPPPAREKAITRLDAVYPAASRELNVELCKLLVYLQAPGAATKTMALMTKAPTQEEQLDYALALRNLTSGWTIDLRKTYFSWFVKAASYRGGYSFAGFVSNIKKDAAALLSDEEQASLKLFLEESPKIDSPWANARPMQFVKNWTTDELLPLIDKRLVGRDYDRGRQLFGEIKCYACHRFNNEGGSFGPDLTALSGRFSPRDVIDKVINPGKYISNQFAALTITTVDGKVITGRIVNLFGDDYVVNTNMLDPNSLTKVGRTSIETMVPSKISMMPAGLLDVLHQDEILDLLAYLLSRGDRKQKMFAQ
ncbi:MAG TPA: c-type cytochrome, partial [Gemmataceae bacterium]|nr:c-type cytochrome [Gemmataceae bacterium]